MKLLITGSTPWTGEQLEQIAHLGHEITFVQDERVPLYEQGIDAGVFEGVICNSIFLYNDIRAFHSLYYIQLTSAGYDRISMDYIKEHQITIHNARGVYSIPMAEFAIVGVLQLYKQSRYFLTNQGKHEWKKRRELRELYGKTVCIVGCGSVGTECAKRFSAFGCKVLGVDLYPSDKLEYEKVHPIDELDGILAKSDIVVLTLPLTEQTRYLMNRERLGKMKPDAFLINIARGNIIDTDALIRALEEKTIAGAVLDVLEEEPLNDSSPLWDMENVIITPHNSFVGEGNKKRLFDAVKNNLLGRQNK